MINTTYRFIDTEIPHPKDVGLLEQLAKYEARSMHGQLPIVWDHAIDFQVYDRHKNMFLDFTSGIATTNMGHSNGYHRMALGNLLNKPLIHSYTFPTEPRFAYMKALIGNCYKDGKAFLVSAGTEATEVACKLMKMYKPEKGRFVIYSIKGAMHGRTMLAERLKGPTEDNKWAFNPMEEFKDVGYFNPFEDKIEDVENLIKEARGIAGIMIESYQGWSARFYPIEWIQRLVKICKEKDIPVCFDEIQGGFGRTGKMWAWEHYNIERPDLICFGKGAGNGFPLSGVLGRADILDLPEVGSMSSTHSANPLACVSGLINLWRLTEDNLIEEAKRKGNIIYKELVSGYDEDRWEWNLDKIETIQGEGLVWAIITKTTEEADRIVNECFKQGLLVIWTHKNSVKICPPLTIKDDALLEGLNVIKEIISVKH